MPHKLLLADDSVTIQRVIELTFADEDVQVVAVSNGQQAIDRVDKERPDIILADVGMPERDGYEVAAYVKGHPGLAHIPVVLLTGAFEPIDETRARAVGCDGVLVKPFEPQMVIGRVKDLLAGRKPAGLWGSGPAAQGPVRPAAGVEVPSAAPAPDGDPLEAYFDRLDAAFSAMETGGTGSSGGAAQAGSAAAAESAGRPGAAPREAIPVSRPPAMGAPVERSAAVAPRSSLDDIGSWDPDLAGDPARPAPIEPVVAFPADPAAPAAQPWSPVPGGPPIAAHPAASPAPPSMVDAFAALLEAEQRTSVAPSQAPDPRAAADAALIERVAERVLARLNESSVQPLVLDAAERLVREEIERIKSHS